MNCCHFENQKDTKLSLGYMLRLLKIIVKDVDVKEIDKKLTKDIYEAVVIHYLKTIAKMEN